MKIIVVLLCLTTLISPFLAFGQNWYEMMRDQQRYSFKEVINTYTRQHKEKDTEKKREPKKAGNKSPDAEEEREDESDAIFNRYKWYWEKRVDKNGNYPDQQKANRDWKEFEASSKSLSKTGTSVPAYTSEGPNSTPGGYSGIGHIRFITFHPTNPNIFYPVSNGGHVWKTTDGGATYKSLTDHLPAISIQYLALDQSNPERLMFIRYPDHALYETLDGGNNWSTINTGGLYLAGMIQNPANSNEWWGYWGSQFYRSLDNAHSWTKLSEIVNPFVQTPQDIKNFTIKPGSGGTTMYCTSGFGPIYFYKSTNSGVTWQLIQTLQGATIARLVTCATTPEVVIACTAAGPAMDGIYKSTNSGQSFSKIYTATSSTNLFSYDYPSYKFDGQAGWGYTYEINPQNPNQHFCGSINNFRSNDGGVTWQLITHWSGGPVTTHADKHFLKFNPADPGKLYECNDGGVYRSSDNGTSWTSISNTLVTSEIYKVTPPPLKAVRKYSVIGTQDNGSKLRSDNGTWADVLGGDGMDNEIDPLNANNYYVSYQYGNFYRYNLASNTGYYLTSGIPGGTSNGLWVTPITLDTTSRLSSNDPAVVYVGFYHNIWRSTDMGSNWSALPTSLTNVAPIQIRVNSRDTIAVLAYDCIYRTVNGGVTWTKTDTKNVNSSYTYYNSLITDPKNSSRMWVVRSVPSGSKVFYTANGGASWSDISFNLPDGNYMSIEIDFKSPTEDVYIASDNGIAIKTRDATQWSVYGAGLPYVGIDEIQLSYETNRLYVATYGRGLWTIPLANTEAPAVPIVTTSPGITNEQTSQVDRAVTVSHAGKPTLSSANVQFTTNFTAGEDRLGFIGTEQVQYGNIEGVFDAASGTLSLTSAGGTATIAQWQNCLRSVFYQNTNFSKSRNVLPRTITFMVNDGTVNSNIAEKIKAVPPYNELPTITDPPGAVTFIEGNNTPSAPVAIWPQLNMNDPDSNDVVTAARIQIEYLAPPDVADSLKFVNDGETMGNIKAAFDTASKILWLTSPDSTATLAEWVSALRNVKYYNNSETPVIRTRRANMYVLLKLPIPIFGNERNITIVPINDDPVVKVSEGNTLYVHGSAGGVKSDSMLVVSDLDNASLASATIAITNFREHEDELIFAADAELSGNIIGQYQTATGVLSLTSSGAAATMQQWQAALRAIRYQNNAVEPDPTTRTISYTVNDGVAASINGFKNINITLQKPITFNGKVMLEGAFNTGTMQMNNTLNASGILDLKALNQPYLLQFGYAGKESVAPGFFAAHPQVVDWVLIEFRSSANPSVIVGSVAAFVQQDGSITGIDGNSTNIPIGLPPAMYFVSIRHRNHLGIRSSVPIDFTGGSAAYDFTVAANKCFQNQDYPATVLMNGVWAMRGGNANMNANVRYTGPLNDQDRIQNIRLNGSLSIVMSGQYATEDLNMDGILKTNGPANDQTFLLNFIFKGILSTLYNEQL